MKTVVEIIDWLLTKLAFIGGLIFGVIFIIALISGNVTFKVTKTEAHCHDQTRS